MLVGWILEEIPSFNPSFMLSLMHRAMQQHMKLHPEKLAAIYICSTEYF